PIQRIKRIPIHRKRESYADSQVNGSGQWRQNTATQRSLSKNGGEQLLAEIGRNPLKTLDSEKEMKGNAKEFNCFTALLQTPIAYRRTFANFGSSGRWRLLAEARVSRLPRRSTRPLHGRRQKA
ncbi:MAG TPA: hypothetical protein VJY34_24745, partial [Roseiarcus sp.]|nr:hypothetical protein [Roseiarcus sp.]